MTNIWMFLNHTLSISTIAILLFLIKGLLKDKLSPRWQYGVWILLILRMVVPVNVNKALFLPVSLWVEYAKGTVESLIDSVYSDVYQTVAMKHVAPVITEAPQSITDWLFVIYVLGVIVSLAWYFVSYMRLRGLIRKGNVISDEMQRKINYVSAVYDLKNCKVISLTGLKTAFVCGGIHPVLVLPEGQDVDEKVILHELLHLKYHDEWQSIGWCILRSFHWCNPFLQYVFNEIGNEMEALCDQRVLERLEGEELREYGTILLSMANEKYARVPGTSSISNGGKNISKRIESIVRFKKYPKGMALVSICITIFLAFPVIQGTDYVLATDDYHPDNGTEKNYELAVARVNRCETIAGALDTYAKGILFEKEMFLLFASPLDKHEEFSKGNSWNDYWLEEYNSIFSYSVWNIVEKEENTYSALLLFSADNTQREVIVVPVEIRLEDGWVVEETGERRVVLYANSGLFNYAPDMGIAGAKQYRAEAEHGTIDITTWTEYVVDNTVQGQNDFFGQFFNNGIDQSLKLDAKFASIKRWDFAEYSCEKTLNGKKPADFFGILYKGLKGADEKIEFEQLYVGANGGGGSGEENWSGQQIGYGYIINSTGHNVYSADDYKNEIMELPEVYAMRIFWDGKQVEEVVVPESDEYVGRDRFHTFYGDSQIAMYIDEVHLGTFAYNQRLIELNANDRMSKEDINKTLEEWRFADEIKQADLIAQLEKSGVYRYESGIRTDIMCGQAIDVEIFDLGFFYDAVEDSWIIICGGYCKEDFSEVLKTGDVGTRDNWGIEFVNTQGIYEVDSYVTDMRASLANEDGSIRKETTNSSSTSETGGRGFELQDYTCRKNAVSDVEYVGYRWYVAVTYASGFEKLTGDVVAYYNHTN